MEKKRHFLIVCGEPSGDLHAGLLCRELLRACPGARVSAVGGTHLAAAGARIVCDIRALSVMGLFDALAHLRRFLRLKDQLLRFLESDPPAAVILVDFSGFNLRFAQAINRRVPVFYYISPQVWASRAGRIRTIKRFIDHLIVFFKFEEDLYRRHGVPVTCVGHPLIDTVRPDTTRQAFCAENKLSAAAPVLALLPGSRTSEIKRILPVMRVTVCLLRRTLPDIQAVIAGSPHVEPRLYEEILGKADPAVRLVQARTYDCLAAADCALVASGTATLETALLKVPFVILYKMGLLNYMLYRPLVRLPCIGMVNIIAGKRIVPEFIQRRCAPEAVAAAVLPLLTDPAEAARMRAALGGLRTLLGEPGAASRAAARILELL